MNQVILDLPKGSLNTKGRGNTQEVFLNAGYDIQGYEPGEESATRLGITNDPEINLFLARPQSMPVELSRRLADLAIVGEDWIMEENDPGIRKIGDLDYGRVRIVAAIPEAEPYQTLDAFFRGEAESGKPILCFTEYLNLTRQWFMQNEAYKELFGDKRPFVQVRGLTDGENKHVQIINSDGVIRRCEYYTV